MLRLGVEGLASRMSLLHVSPAVSDGHAQHATPSSTTQTQYLINSLQIFGSLFFPPRNTLSVFFEKKKKKRYSGIPN